MLRQVLVVEMMQHPPDDVKPRCVTVNTTEFLHVKLTQFLGVEPEDYAVDGAGPEFGVLVILRVLP